MKTTHSLHSPFHPATIVAAAWLLVSAGCDRTEHDWKHAQTANSSEAYQEFVARHPHSDLADSARSRIGVLDELHDWNRADSANTSAAYEEFAARHPGSPRVELARLRSSERKEGEDWEAAARTNTIESVQEFIVKWPQGANASRAQVYLESLKKAGEVAEIVEMTALEWLQYMPDPLAEGVSLKNEELLKRSPLSKMESADYIGRVMDNNMQFVTEVRFYRKPSPGARREPDAKMTRVKDARLVKVGSAVGFVFGETWGVPIQIEGIKRPAVAFRHGAMLLSDGLVRFQEGTEVRIKQAGDESQEYTVSQGSWTKGPIRQ